MSVKSLILVMFKFHFIISYNKKQKKMIYVYYRNLKSNIFFIVLYFFLTSREFQNKSDLGINICAAPHILR